MVMILNTGVPGAGKTYLMIKKFTDLFCSWDKDTERFVLKDEHKDKILISNIENLTLEHLDLESLMSERCLTLARAQFCENVKKHGIDDMEDVIDEYYFKLLDEKTRWFFNYTYQKSLQEKHGSIIYLIEESQRYFDGKELGRQKWVRDIFYFFEKHRHLGMSIFMDTQHVSKLAKGITCLFETEVKAKPRTFSMAGEFKYNEFSDGAKVNPFPIVVRPSKKIFKVYKSMSIKESVKTKKPVLKVILFISVMALISFGVMKYALAHLGGSVGNKKDVPAEQNQMVKKMMPGSKTKKIAIEKAGEWVKLSFVLSSEGVTIAHPVNNSIMNLKELEFEVKRQGIELFCFVPNLGG